MKTKSKRSLFQFGLLTLLLVTLVFAVIASVYSRYRQPIRCLTYDGYRDVASRAIWRVKDYDKWDKYHQSIVDILKTHGTVSMAANPFPDFYHTGDWFDTFVDGFSIGNSKILSATLLMKLRNCVSASDPGATLEFVGIEGLVEGLNILVTQEGAFAYWDGKSASECEARLVELGL